MSVDKTILEMMVLVNEGTSTDKPKLDWDIYKFNNGVNTSAHILMATLEYAEDAKANFIDEVEKAIAFKRHWIDHFVKYNPSMHHLMVPERAKLVKLEQALNRLVAG